MPTSSQTLIDLETKFWQSMIDQDTDTAVAMLSEPALMVSSHGAMTFDHAGYRKMAERVVDLVVDRSFDERELKSCLTGSILLASSDFKSYIDVRSYQQTISEKLKKHELQHHVGELVSNFGKQCDDILGRFEMVDENDKEVRLVKAQLDYCIKMEMVKTGSDFFVRRTGLLYFDLPLLKKVLDPCLRTMATQFNWSDAKLNEEKNEIKRLIDQALNFKI